MSRWCVPDACANPQKRGSWALLRLGEAHLHSEQTAPFRIHHNRTERHFHG